MSRSLLSSPLFYCALILSLWLAFYDKESEALRIATSAQDDWSTSRGAGGRVVTVSSTARLIYTSSANNLLAVQVDNNQQCLPSCPSYVLGNNTQLDYWVSSSTTSKVFFRSGTAAPFSLLGVPWAGGAAAYFDTLSSTSGQFFHLTNGANSRVLLRNNAGDIKLFDVNGNALETMNVTGTTNAYPTSATFNAPLVVRGTNNIDVYWTQGSANPQLWYSLAGSSFSTQANITKTVTSINDNRYFTSTLRYYLIETTDGTTYSLWLVNPASISVPIEVTTGLYGSKSGEYVLAIASTTNYVVFAAKADVNANNTLYRFQTIPTASAPSAIGSFIDITDITLFAGTSPIGVYVLDVGSDLKYTADVTASPPIWTSVNASIANSKSLYTNFVGSNPVRTVVLADSTVSASQMDLFSGSNYVGTYTTAAKNYLISGTDIVWLETTGSNAGLWRATSTSVTPSRLTPSTLTTTQAATIKYIITSITTGANTGTKVIYYVGSTVNEVYSVPIAGCSNTFIAINTQPSPPTPQLSCPGATPAVSVVANGVSGTVYQWQKNVASVWTTVSGATSATYNPTVPASGTDTYRALVTADCGTLVTSNTVSITPTGNGGINTQPSFAPGSVCPGGTITLTTVAGITPNTPTYQWSKDGTAINGATNYTYIFAAVPGNTGNYTCKVQWWCNSVTSNSVRVVINTATSISSHPSNATVCSSVGSHTFSVTAAGTALTYQWYKNGTLISGATLSSYTVSPLDSLVNLATYYHVVVTGTCGTLTSQTAWLNVLPSSTPVITIQPYSKTVCPGSNVRFHVSATGEALSYKWNFNTAQLPTTLNYVNLTKVNSSFAGDYYCTVSTSTCTSISSFIATLTIASSCAPVTTIIITIAGQSAASFNATYRDATFIPAIIGSLSEFGITVTAKDFFIVSVKDGSAIVEFGFTSANANAALQAILDVWNFELGYFAKYGMIAVKDVRAGSAVIITTTTTSATTNNNGGGGGGDGGSNTGAIVGGVVGGILGFAVVCICLILLILLIVFIVLKGGFKFGGSKKWKQQNWWEEDDL